ncbi:MAG: ice-binding family protein [Acidobacteriota bacterium]
MKSFAVLGGSTVTNTGTSVITGNVGVSPGPILAGPAGFPPGLIGAGTFHANDAVAATAQNELTTAYNEAASTVINPCPALNDLTGQDLGGLTLVPGVYCFSSSAQLTGTLTLNLQNNPNALFIFQIGTTLTTANASSVVLINSGGTTCPTNLFWQVGSSATLGTTTSFVGNILALQSITLTTGASVVGRTLARNGAVTLDTNTVNTSTCGAAVICPVITLSPATLPPPVVGIPYTATVTASGGTGPYSFALTGGSLPAGLALTGATGTSINITGTPTSAAPFSFQLTATDTTSPTCFGTVTYSGLSSAGTSAGGPTLDSFGLVALLGLLALAGVYAANRFSS